MSKKIVSNEYRVMPDGTVQIVLSQNQVTIVDREDFEKVHAYRWFAYWSPKTRGFYVKGHSSGGKRITIFMHRVILDAPPGIDVDHVNRNGLDNRRCNIRLCTRSQNMSNGNKRKGTTSRFRGVSFNRSTNSWRAEIRVRGKGIYLGLFSNEIDAARAHDEAAIAAFGEFVNLNFQGDANGSI